MLNFIKKIKEKTDNLLVIFLFALLSATVWLLSIGSFSKTNSAGQSGLFQINGTALNYQIAIPLFIFFILSCFFIIIIRFNQVKHNFKFCVVFGFVFVFIITRIISIFTFPYGTNTFTFTSDINNISVPIEYAFPLSDRITQFFSDFCFALYLLIVFNFLPKGKNWNRLMVISEFALIGVAFAAKIYALCLQYDVFIMNFMVAFGIPTSSSIQLITSFTSNKNVYGLLLMLGLFSSMMIYYRRPNVISIIVALFLFLNIYISRSRTPLFLSLFFMIGTLIFYFIFNYKNYKKHAIASLVFGLIILIATLVILFLSLNEKVFPQLNSIIDHLFNTTTIDTRKEHWRTSLDLMNNARVIIFGYSRIPFCKLYYQYEVAIGGETRILFSHNAFLEILVHYGAIVLIMVLIATIYLIYLVFKTLKTSSKNLFFVYFFMFAAILIYTYFESRYFFVDEGTNVLLLLVFVFPLLNDNQREYSLDTNFLVID